MRSTVTLRPKKGDSIPIWASTSLVVPEVQHLATLMLELSVLGIKRYGSRSRVTVAHALSAIVLVLGDAAGIAIDKVDTIVARFQRLPLPRLREIVATTLEEQMAGRHRGALRELIGGAGFELVVGIRDGEAAFCDRRRLDAAQRLGLMKLVQPESPRTACPQLWISRHDGIERLVATDARRAAAGEEPAYGDRLLRHSFAEWLAIALIGCAPVVGFRVLNDRKGHLERIFRRRPLVELRAAAQWAREHFEQGNLPAAYDVIRGLWRRPIIVFEEAA